MTSEPIQKAIKGLLAEAATATSKLDWATVASLVDAVLKLDPANADAIKLKSLALNNGVSTKVLLLDAAAATAKMDWNGVSSLANAVLKLEPNNVDALKFQSLASDQLLAAQPIGMKVQEALAANEQAKAVALVRTYLAENPDDQAGLKAQNLILEERQRQRVQQSSQQVSTRIREPLPYGRESGLRHCHKCNRPSEGDVCTHCGSGQQWAKFREMSVGEQLALLFVIAVLLIASYWFVGRPLASFLFGIQ
jgi:hypothetical protein